MPRTHPPFTVSETLQVMKQNKAKIHRNNDEDECFSISSVFHEVLNYIYPLVNFKDCVLSQHIKQPAQLQFLIVEFLRFYVRITG